MRYAIRNSVVVAIVLALAPAFSQEPDAKERQAIAALKKLGAEFETDDQSKLVIGVTLSDCRITDAVIGQLRALPNLESLDLFSCPIGSKEISKLSQLAKLRKLDFYLSEKFTDKELAAVKGLENLQELGLEGTSVTDAGVVQLKGHRKLERLILTKTSVTDAGLGPLSECPNLKWLWLTNTAITDKGLALLEKTSTLEQLNVIGTKVTEKGLADLKRSNPKLTIHSR